MDCKYSSTCHERTPSGPVHCRWLLIRGNLTLKCVSRGIDNVAVQGRWPLTTGGGGSPKAGTTVLTLCVSEFVNFILFLLLSCNLKINKKKCFVNVESHWLIKLYVKHA